MKGRGIALLASLWRFIAWTWGIFIIGIVIGVLGNTVYTYLTTGKMNLPGPGLATLVSFLRAHPYEFVLILTLVLLITLCTFLAYRVERRKTQASTEHPALTQRSLNRQRMLAKVHNYWIKGVLEKSLHGAALIALGLHEQREAISHPWRLVLQHLDEPEHSLPPGTRILKVYDDANGELLILGEPGSGKTTLLLELTRDLLDRARQDETHPIPVVFNLSSWAFKRQSLTKWLVEELNTKYQVPRKLGQLWIEHDQVLPLLDGLDEVALVHRAACVDTINSYRREHGWVSTVVCSRSTDYFVQTKRLRLDTAVVVQPLSKQQIDDYISSAESQLAPLRVALRDDPILHELAATPLMLSVMALAYQGKSVGKFSSSDPDTIRRQIFDAYVQRILKQRRPELLYPPQLTIHWLSWLARQLTQHKQTEFYLERMQLDWLQESRFHRFYASIFVGLVYGTFLTLVYGIAFGLNLGLPIQPEPLTGVACGLLIGLLNWLIYVLLNGGVFRLHDKLDTEKQPTQVDIGSWMNIRRNLIRFLRNRLLYGLLFGLPSGLLIGLLGLLNNFFTGLNAALILGLLNGLCIGISYGVFGRLNAEIQPTEVIVWSWRSIRQNLVKSFGIGLLTGLLWGLAVALAVGNIVGDLLAGVIYGLLFGFELLLVNGLSNEMLSKDSLVRPNQGIWSSMRNGVRTGLLSGLVSGIVYGITFGLGVSPYQGLVYGLIFGLATGLIFWVLKGGNACILHVFLRLRLWHEGSIPWNYVHFLDYAVERILLRKVGGGYIFIHRLLLEYIAALDITPTSGELAEQK